LSLLLDAKSERDVGFAFEHPHKNGVDPSVKNKQKKIAGRKTAFGFTVNELHCRTRTGRVCDAPLLQVSHVIVDQP